MTQIWTFLKPKVVRLADTVGCKLQKTLSLQLSGNSPFSFAFGVYQSSLGFILVSKYEVYLVHVLYPFQGVRALEVYMSVLACWYAQAFISKRASDCFHGRTCALECLFPNVRVCVCIRRRAVCIESKGSLQHMFSGMKEGRADNSCSLQHLYNS